ncbi:hypothetical protein CYV26_11560 [Carnobacterium maltaromaticum]|nr:hypothetical protein CYV33_11545 [Carnobacterium maltaromaticum]PLS35727.1 hypothetical protein CYV30_08370 [Carnobacterium maltaromaticum]PLS36176.1 hypothetical protein CYV31_08375 [Carnobacterium maltaromaticum]PLS42633.1 hypothetical protein CYV27_11545 [Carnobacterium maltaromaticum]PLS42868.1 hypothetical protein CYV28_08385 [Carnobacterium maltaromaticum]
MNLIKYQLKKLHSKKMIVITCVLFFSLLVTYKVNTSNNLFEFLIDSNFIMFFYFPILLILLSTFPKVSINEFMLYKKKNFFFISSIAQLLITQVVITGIFIIGLIVYIVKNVHFSKLMTPSGIIFFQTVIFLIIGFSIYQLLYLIVNQLLPYGVVSFIIVYIYMVIDINYISKQPIGTLLSIWNKIFLQSNEGIIIGTFIDFFTIIGYLTFNLCIYYYLSVTRKEYL